MSTSDVRVVVHDTRADAERVLALEIRELLARVRAPVLGLATGNTPVGLYRALALEHAAGRVSFAHASSFNLDEYLDLDRGDPRRFREWMRVQWFDSVDLPRARARFPDVDAADLDVAAREYEAEIVRAGGIDLQVLGLGRNGHIGFNEPGSGRESRTRVVDLAASTRADAAATFGGLAHVPHRAITMGVATILDARRIRVLAFGAAKADVVRAFLHDPVSSACPATFLRGHADCELHVDRAAHARE